jgi:hypothetical protein
MQGKNAAAIGLKRMLGSFATSKGAVFLEARRPRAGEGFRKIETDFMRRVSIGTEC